MKTLAIDFDGTLCKKQPYGDGDIWEVPNQGAAEAMKLLRKEGYKIVIFTVRLDPDRNDDVAMKRKKIEDWLELHEIEYDVITNNKPMAQAYIDDRAVRFTNWKDITNYFVQ